MDLGKCYCDFTIYSQVNQFFLHFSLFMEWSGMPSIQPIAVISQICFIKF